MKKACVLVALICCLLIGFAAFADGETRAKTAAEKEWFKKVAQACGSAIAGISSDWEVDSRSDAEETDRINTGAEDYPLVHYYHIAWKDHKKFDEAQVKVEEAMSQMLPKLQEQQNSTDTSAYDRLAEKMGAAVEAGNLVEVERLSKELEAMAKKLEASYDPLNSELKGIIEKYAPRDATLSVRIKLNQFNESFSEPVSTGKLKDGSDFYRLENGGMYNESWVEGMTYVFLGNGWKKSVEEGMTTLAHPEFADRPYTDIRCIIIEVQAEKGRAQNTLNSMNLAALKSMIK